MIDTVFLVLYLEEKQKILVNNFCRILRGTVPDSGQNEEGNRTQTTGEG